MTIRQRFFAVSIGMPFVTLGLAVLSQLYLPAWSGIAVFVPMAVWTGRLQRTLRCPHCNGALYSSWPHVSREERRKPEAFLVGECPHCLGPV